MMQLMYLQLHINRKTDDRMWWVCISIIQDLLDPLLFISVTNFKARYKVEYPPYHSDSVQGTLK